MIYRAECEEVDMTKTNDLSHSSIQDSGKELLAPFNMDERIGGRFGRELAEEIFWVAVSGIVPLEVVGQ